MPYSDWLDSSGLLLGPAFPLPLDRPFTRPMAERAGLRGAALTTLTDAGLLRHPLQGVYLASQAVDNIETRARSVMLVVSPDAVVTDRTAAWLHGVTILERGAHLLAPPVSAFNREDSRIRRSTVRSGRRGLLDRDVTEVLGLPVTTPLRTACDLGRSLWRYDGLGALDQFLAIGVPHGALIGEIPRFRGHRGVRQLRELVPLADARSESPGESAVRLHWYDAGLPKPEPQYWVADELGVLIYRIDLALPGVRYAAEYDGEEFHTLDADRSRDEERRTWLAERQHWTIDVFDKGIYRGGDPVTRLREGFEAARRSVSIWTPGLPSNLTGQRLPTRKN